MASIRNNPSSSSSKRFIEGFGVALFDCHEKEIVALPSNFNKQPEKYRFPGGDVILMTKDGYEFNAFISKKSGCYYITSSWNSMKKYLGITEEGFLFFKLNDDLTYSVIYFAEYDRGVSSDFIAKFVSHNVDLKQELSIPVRFVETHRQHILPLTECTIKCENYQWSVYLDVIGNELVFTKGWDNVYSDLGVELHNLMIFELVSWNAFTLTLLEFPALKSAINTNPVNVFLVHSVDSASTDDTNTDDDESDATDDTDMHDDDEAVELVKRLSSKFRLPKEWAIKVGLAREVEVSFTDGNFVDIDLQVKIEHSENRERYYVSRFTKFMKAMDLNVGDTCTFKFFKNMGVFLLYDVVKKDD